MTFRAIFDLGDSAVYLRGNYDPPRARGAGEYGSFRVDHGHVVARDPFQIAMADGIEGPSLDAVVGKAMARVGRATW